MDQIIKSKNAKNRKERKCLTTTKKSVKSHSTAQHSTAQHSTAQHSTALTSFFLFFQEESNLNRQKNKLSSCRGNIYPLNSAWRFFAFKNFQKEENS